jgi:hypothetical protein
MCVPGGINLRGSTFPTLTVKERRRPIARDISVDTLLDGAVLSVFSLFDDCSSGDAYSGAMSSGIPILKLRTVSPALSPSGARM